MTKIIQKEEILPGDLITGVGETGRVVQGVATSEYTNDVGVTVMKTGNNTTYVGQIKEASLRYLPKATETVTRVVIAEREGQPPGDIPRSSIKIGLFGGSISSIQRVDGLHEDMVAMVQDHDTNEEYFVAFNAANSIKIKKK